MNFLPLLSKINYWGEAIRPSGKVRSTYVDRLLNQADDPNISAVMGVRRSGKSTILLHTLFYLITRKNVETENTLYVNFEDPRLLDLLVDNNLFLLMDEFNTLRDKRTRGYVFFDEIQNVQNWELILRTIIDQEKNLKVYITGSSATLLGKELGTKLTGRYLSTEVFPLSYQELTQFKKPMTPKKAITLGGFPDHVIATSIDTKEQLLKDYFESILLKDISFRYNLRNDFKLRRLATHLYTNISNQASSYRLSKDLDLSADTVLQYFSYIQDAYLGFFIPKYADSVRKQEYNPKKFYAIDTALQQIVAFKVFDDLGKLFENLLFLELRRVYKDIYYWEEETEVDFLVRTGEKICYIINSCVSIKNEQTKNREIESLQNAMYFFKYPHSYLVIMDGNPEKIHTDIGTIEVVLFGDFVKQLHSSSSES